MNERKFYDSHCNFVKRTISDYYLSPGIRAKFDILKKYLGTKRKFERGIDLGCSGNSFLFFFDGIKQKSFLDIANFPLKQYSQINKFHPICGSLTHLPYRDNSFHFISALDVLEHVKDDELAISEISRILKKKGIFVITVPHRMKYYTQQDQIIGHYRRYEIAKLKQLFENYHLKNIRAFGVYGQLMRIAESQSTNPEKTEKSLLKLRERYESDLIFRKFWKFAVDISARIMKIDAKYLPLKKIMNIGLIFEKII